MTYSFMVLRGRSQISAPGPRLTHLRPCCDSIESTIITAQLKNGSLNNTIKSDSIHPFVYSLLSSILSIICE